MKAVFVILLFLLAMPPMASAHCSKAFHLVAEEILALEKAAAADDGEAAMRLYLFYSMSFRDSKKAEPWLHRAAELNFGESRNLLATMIKQGHYSPGEFGNSKEDAVEALLKVAAETDGRMCHEIAGYYADGYFWYKNPESDDGKASWLLREKIAKKLSIEELTGVWSEVDAFIAKTRSGAIKVEPPVFSAGETRGQERVQAMRRADVREQAHRQRLQGGNGE